MAALSTSAGRTLSLLASQRCGRGHGHEWFSMLSNPRPCCIRGVLESGWGGAPASRGHVYLGEDRPPLTDGEEGGVGEASLAAGDVDGGVDESTLEPEGAASSESPLGRSWAVLSSPLPLPPEQLWGQGRSCRASHSGGKPGAGSRVT